MGRKKIMNIDFTLSPEEQAVLESLRLRVMEASGVMQIRTNDLVGYLNELRVKRKIAPHVHINYDIPTGAFTFPSAGSSTLGATAPYNLN